MSGASFLGLGELLWDCFPDRRLPGGAPANVAFHAQQLGLAAATVTRVGWDSLGDEICQFLQSQGLSLDLVQRDPQHGTGTVTVETSRTQSTYTFKPDSAWDFLEPQPTLLAAMKTARAVCFGTLAQRSSVSRETIHACLESASPESLIVCDVNLRPPFFDRAWIERSIRHAHILKLNNDEVRVLAEMFGSGTESDVTFAQWLFDRFNLRLVCVTRGGNGCLVASRSEIADVPGVAIRVADTVGAGDAFTAALIYATLAAWPLRRTAEFANQIGSLVASRPGAMPILKDEFAECLRRYGS